MKQICKPRISQFRSVFWWGGTPAQPERSGTTENNVQKCVSSFKTLSRELSETGIQCELRNTLVKRHCSCRLAVSHSRLVEVEPGPLARLSLKNASFGLFPSRHGACESLRTFPHQKTERNCEILDFAYLLQFSAKLLKSEYSFK